MRHKLMLELNKETGIAQVRRTRWEVNCCAVERRRPVHANHREGQLLALGSPLAAADTQEGLEPIQTLHKTSSTDATCQL